MVHIDKPLDEIESWDPGASGSVKPGMHEVQIAEVKLEDTKNGSGYQKVSMKCKVVAGECIGGNVFINKSLHPNALGYFRGMLDILNCYATSQDIDEQKLKGKYMRALVEEVPKTDGTGGTVIKTEKLFVSEINADKNLATDISEGAKARPVAAPQHSVAGRGQVAGGGNGRPAASSRQAPPQKIDDLPF